MKRLLKRMRRNWERVLFWVFSVVLAMCLVMLLTQLWQEPGGHVRPRPSVRVFSSLLNPDTCFEFLDEHPDLPNRNPFEFSHRAPEPKPDVVETPDADDPAPRSPTRTGTRTGANVGQGESGRQEPPIPATDKRPTTTPRGVKAAREPDPGAKIDDAAMSSPPRTVAVTFKGILRGSSGKTLAFVKAEDSARGGSVSGPVAAGERIAEFTVTSVDSGRLTVETPKGETAAIKLGQPHRFRMP